jgi:hypothetical protein
MSKRKRICFSFLVMALVFFVNACGPPLVNLQVEELAPGAMTRGSVVVGTVLNKRAEDIGSEGFNLIGKLRGTYGTPIYLKAEENRDLDIVLKEVSKAALEHTGYSTKQVAGKFYRLDIDLLTFWCDGYMGYKIEAEIAAKLVDPENESVLVKKVINVQKGFSTAWSIGPMHTAFNEVLTDIQKDLVAFMQSQEFRDAVKQ